MSVRGKSQSSPQGARGTISLLSCIVFGAAIGGFAALGAMRFGEAFGSLLPIAAAAFGALAGRVFFSTLKRKTDDASRSNESRAGVDGPSDESDSAEQSEASVSSTSAVSENLQSQEQPDSSPVPPPAEPEWPVETYEVQVKLDLARSYVEMGDAELAVQYLQEVLEMELAVGRKLGSEVLQETRQKPPEEDAVGLE